MVSKASDDFPDPLTPVTTVMAARGKETSMFLRLFWRAPVSRTRGAEFGDAGGSAWDAGDAGARGEVGERSGTGG